VPWQRPCLYTRRDANVTVDGPGVEHRVLELGADDCIIKPFDPSILLSRVNAVFRRLKVMAA
jgi:PleD family two-component response regulator